MILLLCEVHEALQLWHKVDELGQDLAGLVSAHFGRQILVEQGGELLLDPAGHLPVGLRQVSQLGRGGGRVEEQDQLHQVAQLAVLAQKGDGLKLHKWLVKFHPNSVQIYFGHGN